MLTIGRVVYYGTTKDAVQYFSAAPISFPYPTGQNPADYVVNVATVCCASNEEVEGEKAHFERRDAELGSSRVDLASLFLSTTNYSKFSQTYDAAASASMKPTSRLSGVTRARKRVILTQYTSTLNQIRVLCYRSILLARKNWIVLVVTFLRHIGTSYFLNSVELTIVLSI
jgi:hypothetical protein